VTFAGPSSGASTNPASNSAVTNSAGVATKQVTANTIAGGPYTVTATVGMLTPANFSLTNTPGMPATIAITGGNNQTATIGTPFAPLQIIVKDSFGNAEGAGVNVTFMAPASGPSGRFANNSNTITLPTSASGTISAAFTANTLGGPAYNVTLASAGVNSPPSFTLKNTGINVSSSVSVTQGGFGRNRATGLWSATMPVTNTSGSTISGPVQVVLTNLTPGVTMTNNTGTFNGSPFITVSAGALAPGAAASVTIQFSNPSNGFISYTPVTYSGGL
jgi:hypothetical protein